MTDKKPPMGRLIIPGPSESTAARQPPLPLPRGKPMRTLDECRPLAQQVAANTDLMQRFRKVMGCDNENIAREMVDEVRQAAQALDPTITYAEGAQITLLLMKIVGGSNQP